MSSLDHIRLSTSQRDAVLDRSPRVLVAAGAGSGKTSLLVAYFVHALLDDGLPLERLVAVTFTRKAAGELVDRIRRTLAQQGRSDLARALDTGAVGTIHSLCRRLLKENALEAAVDPAFTVLEADAADLLKREAAAQAWEEAVLEAGDEELDVLAQHHKMLQSELPRLYDALRAAGMEAPRFAVATCVDEGGEAERLQAAVRSALQAASELPRRTATVEQVIETMQECLEWACSFDSATRDDHDLTASREYFPRRISSLDSHLTPVREALTCCRNRLAQARLEPLVRAMDGLLVRLHERYTELKRARQALDFLDLELRTRAFLERRPPEAEPVFGPEARVMIDEFQDTNELQCSILEHLGAGALLMVGDERQSIYRFRGADVEVFSRRQDSLAAGGDDPGGALHRLDTNYRSRREVLAFINRLFAGPSFFGARFVPLECGREDGPEHAPHLSVAPESGVLADGASVGGTAAVEVVVVDLAGDDDSDDVTGSRQEAEAEAAASTAARLVREQGWSRRDVVILLPALTHAELYQGALRAHGLDCYLVRGKGYYSREEVTDVRCLLQLLVDPNDDLALVTVLRSPFVDLSDDALYLLGREARALSARSLWEVASSARVAGLPQADHDLLRLLQDRLSVLSPRAGRPGLAGLIDDAVTLFGYDLRVLASNEGPRRFANIRKLMRLAGEYEALHGPDLAGFVRVIADMEDLSDKEGSAATLTEGEDVVRVMTIHQAKGLEFPVVILAGLGSDPPADSHGSFVVDRSGRKAVFLKASRRDTYEDHDLCWGPGVEIVESDKAKARAEDVRLLYVAMTRAEERLVLVGARPNAERMEKSRMGRILLALGSTELPESRAAQPIPDAHAVVRYLTYAQATEGCVVSASEEPQVVEPGDGSETQTHETLEEEVTVTASLVPRILSFSALSAYHECPRRYYLERVLGLRLVGAETVGIGEGADFDDAGLGRPAERLDPAEATAGREVGLLVHALLERLALGDPVPSMATLRGLVEELSGPGEWHGASAGARAGGPALRGSGRESTEVGAGLSPEAIERTLDLVQAFWRSPIAGGTGLGAAAKEVAFSLLHGDVLMTGVMDLAWREGSSFSIVDYKTNCLAGRSAQDAAEHYRLQAQLYCLAALRSGAERVRMDLLFLEDPQAPITFEYCMADEPVLSARLDEALAPLLAGDYAACRGEQCARCSLATVCAGLA